MRENFGRFIAVALVGAAAASEPACFNPAAASPVEWGADWLTVQLPGTPGPFPDGSTTCSAFAGQSSCCSAEALEEIDTKVSGASAQIRAALTAFRAVKPAHVVLAAVQDMCRASGACNAKVQATIGVHTEAMLAAQDSLAKADQQCFDGTAALVKGLACFQCLADPEPFLDAPSKSVRLSPETCDGAFAACSPLFEAYRALAEEAVALANALERDLGSATALIDPNVLPSLCGGTAAAPGDCKAFLCSTVINGFAVPTLRWDSPSLASSPPSARPGPPSLATALRRVSRLVGRSETTYPSQFAAPGYDAYAVGCADAACPTVGPPSQFEKIFRSKDDPNETMPWYGYVIFGVTIAASIALCCYRKFVRGQPFCQRRRFITLPNGRTHPG